LFLYRKYERLLHQLTHPLASNLRWNETHRGYCGLHRGRESGVAGLEDAEGTRLHQTVGSDHEFGEHHSRDSGSAEIRWIARLNRASRGLDLLLDLELEECGALTRTPRRDRRGWGGRGFHP